MASQIAYAPQADLNNTLLGQLMPAVELSQRMKMQDVQTKALEQELSQSAQLFPQKMANIQLDHDIKAQQLAEAQKTSDFRVGEEQGRMLLLKANAQREQVMADSAKQLNDALLNIQQQQGELLKTQNKFAEPEAKQKLAYGEKEQEALGLSIDAARLNNIVGRATVANRIQDGELGIRERQMRLQEGAAQLQTMQQQLEAGRAQLSLQTLDHLSQMSPASRSVIINQMKDTGGIWKVLADNPDSYSDQNLLTIKQRLANNILQDPVLGPSMMGVQANNDIGAVIGPDGKLTIGNKRGLTQSHWEQILNKTFQDTMPPKGKQNSTVVDIPGGGVKTKTQNSVSNNGLPTNDEDTPTPESFNVEMKSVNKFGDDYLSRGLYHATQQKKLDRQPLSGAAAYPEYQRMLATLPNSGIITNGEMKDGDTGNVYKLSPQDRTTFTQFWNAAAGVGVDTKKPENLNAAEQLGYDPDAKPSQVLAFRSILDYFARAKADYYQRTVPERAMGFGDGVAGVTPDMQPVDEMLNRPKGAVNIAPFIRSGVINQLTPTQQQGLSQIAYKMGLIDAKGNPIEQ